MFYRLIGAALVLLTSCSYSLRKADFRPEGHAADQSYAFFLPVVENTTSRAGAEATLTQALREALSGVKNIRLVGDPANADYFLLGTLEQFAVRRSTVRTGDSGTAAEGGLADKQVTASQINLKMALRVRLLAASKVETKPAGIKVSAKPLVWDRSFEREAIFEASARDSDVKGASSAPFVNASREQVQIKLLSEGLAQNVLDQLVLSF